MADSDSQPDSMEYVQAYDFSANYNGYTNILLVDSSLRDTVFTSSTNNKTFSITFDEEDDLTLLNSFLTTKFPFVRRIGIVTHGPASAATLFRVPQFIGSEQFFTDADLVPNAAVLSSRVQFLRNLVLNMSLTRIDFLGCNLLQRENWKKYFDVLKFGFPDLVIGASLDNTGNLKYGGNWTMENTGDNIKTEYFSSGITNYTGLLTTYTADANGFTWVFNNSAGQWQVTQMYELGTTTNALVGGANGNPTDVIIPETLNDGTADRVIEIQRVSWYTITRSFTSVTFPSGFRGVSTGNNDSLGFVENKVQNKMWGAQILDFSLCSNLLGFAPSVCSGMSTVTTIKLHPNMKSFGYNCFRSCPLLITVDFGTGASNIELGSACFYKSYDVVINDFSMFSSFGDDCFRECTDLPSVLTSSMLPTSLTSIGTTPFNGCTQITSIDMSLIDMSGVAVNTWGAPNATYIAPNNMTILGNLYSGNTTIVNLVLPTTVTSLAGTQTFNGCTNLQTITNFPSAATSIPEQCFYNCSSLTSFTVPTTVTSIGSQAFSNCSSLSSLVLHDGITTIDQLYTFNGCTSLTSFTIPAGFTGTFGSNNSIPANITYLNTGGATQLSTGAGNLQQLETVYVPGNSMTRLTIAQTTNKLRNISVPSTLTAISASDFNNIASATFQNIKVTIRNEAADEEYRWSGAITDATSLANAINGFTNTFGGNAAAFAASANTKKTRAMPTISIVNNKIQAAGFAPGIDITDTAIVGSTLAEKRAYTLEQFEKIFDKYDSSFNDASTNEMVLNDVTLPGFEKTFSTLKAYNVKTNNTKIPHSEYVRGADSYLAIRNIGHQVEFPKSSSSDTAYDVIVRTGQTTYTLNGVSYSRGDTATVGDVTYTFGSVQTSISDVKKLDFILTAFDTSMVLTRAGELSDLSFSLTTDATITLNTDVSNELLRNTFFYRTDDAILADSSFVAFFVDDTAFTNMQSTMNPKNGLIKTTSDGAYIANDNISKDFLRDLARQLFGTYLGADLFTNEDSVVTNINSKCDVVAANIMTKMQDVNISSTANAHLDASLNYYFLKDDPSNLNICREIVVQMITQDTKRFQDISGLSYSNTYDGYWKVPFQAGDVLKYQLTVTPATNQVTAIDTGSGAMTPRTYTVKLNVV
jgi:hypothetical protein